MSTTSKPGPESKITVELIHRVSKLVARGVPIRLALQAESVTFDAYKKHLQRHPELAAIQAAAKIKFLQVCTDVISAKGGPTLRWLLERRHSRDFGPNAHVSDDGETDTDTETGTMSQTQTQIQTIAGVPQHLVEEARKNAQKI